MSNATTLTPGYILHGRDNHYKILRVLGQGTFGITYLAQTRVKMEGELGGLDITVQVAVKEFFMREVNGREGSSVTTGSDGQLYADYCHKFRNEATHLSRLRHTGIVRVLEAFDQNNTVYYIMEHLPGGSLDARIGTKGLSEEEAVRHTLRIGEALAFMHEQKMLHLDLKPGNVMLDKDGKAVLIDFGLSKQYTAQGDPESSTSIGAGTPGYAPIEQANYREGKEFPVTMDIYALGATLFKMITGQPPHTASEILNDGFPTDILELHGVSQRLINVVRKAMMPIKKDRYQSITEMLEELGKEEVDESTVLELRDEFNTGGDENTIFETKIIGNSSQVFTVNGVSFSMIFVEGGTFLMGSNDNEAENDEKPVHKVTLSDYYIGETEVTQELWQAVMSSNPSYFKGSQRPVERVSWKNCQEFINELNSLTGMNFRLPTEAEWEFAARGGNSSQGYKYSGSNELESVSWNKDNSNGETHNVKGKCPNELGIYDMSGNVWEWCNDWYGIYSSDLQEKPQGPLSGLNRVFRGSGYCNSDKHCRSTFRSFNTPGNRFNFLGLRLALS